MAKGCCVQVGIARSLGGKLITYPHDQLVLNGYEEVIPAVIFSTHATDHAIQVNQVMATAKILVCRTGRDKIQESGGGVTPFPPRPSQRT